MTAVANLIAACATRLLGAFLTLLLSYHLDKHTPFKSHFWSCDLSDCLKCYDTIYRNFSQACFIHVLNLKRIRPVVAKLKAIKNAGAGYAGGPTLSPLSPKYKQASCKGRLNTEDLGVVDPSKNSQPMISYRLFSFCKIPEPIMEKTQSLFANTL